MVRWKSYTREEWLKERQSTIGGSDAGVILGVCPWKTNADLWEEKVGVVIPKDVSDNPLVRYGVQAEEHLRAMFKLDYPQYEHHYAPDNIWTNDEYPFAHASLDGWMFDGAKMGILEIKTATISSKAQKQKWEGNHIPDNYYAQILLYFAVTNASFAYLKAQLKYEIDGEEPFLHTKHYRIEREEVENDIEFLIEKCKEFDVYIKTGNRPPTELPQI